MLLLHSRVFFVRLQIYTHENVIMGDRLHVLNVILQAYEITKAEQREHLYRRFLLADEFRFDFVQAKIARQIDDLSHHRAREAPPAMLRQDEHTDSADVPFPAAKLTMQSRVPHDFS